MPTLMESIFTEMNRVRELITEYKRIPNNAGFLGASLMELEIKKTEHAIATDNLVDMLVMYEKLKTFE